VSDGMAKPARLFGRDTEWRELSEFASATSPGATLGLVYGRRRQGKTLMLELLARQAGGFMFAATLQSEAQNLADFGAAYAAFVGLRQPVVFSGWQQALDELLRLGERNPVPAVIDEFPYLVATSPGLPSYLQRALSPLGYAKENTQTRLILCGSAVTTMSSLLGGGAPLRGRAFMELVVRPFGYREAATFWGSDADPELAFRVNALVGGTPAYLEMCGGAGPQDLEHFEEWVARRLLNPASAMFREGGLLLREEPSIADPTSYSAVLAAVSAGNHRRSQIAAALGRPSSALGHLLSGLVDVGLIDQVDDALRDRRTVFGVAEPVVRLHQLIVGRREPELVAGRAGRVWESAADTVNGRIYGPHFENLSRRWCFEHASAETLGGTASRVSPTQIGCHEHRRGHELDIVAIESVPFGTDQVIAIGEAKGTADQVGRGQLERLEHVRSLLPPERCREQPRMLLFSRAGFTAELITIAARRLDVELVDLHRLYFGR
jgi:AAA+ ATPase superfamily predicted ATPase